MGVEERRIRYVDGLRGLAVLAVVMYHVALAYPAHGYAANLIASAGRHGVELFFVLSGFCLSYPTLLALHSRGTATFDILKYGARRIVRIIPPYYAAIVLCALMLTFWVTHPDTPFTLGDILRQALFLDNGTQLVNWAFWTLGLEFRWYFLFPAALVLWVRYPRLYWVAMFALPLLWATRADNNDSHFAGVFAGNRRGPLLHSQVTLRALCAGRGGTRARGGGSD